MNKKIIGTEVSYLDGCVIGPNYIYLASQLDGINSDRYKHTRMTGFDAYTMKFREGSNGWAYHDLNMHTVSVCIKKATAAMSRRVCALSREGELEIYATNEGRGFLEKIPDAGTFSSELQAGITGYVTHVREIGASLYVCGFNGQIYRRLPEGGWMHFDNGLFKPLIDEASEPSNLFTCIDGNAEDDLYVVGMQGVIYHYNGKVWNAIASPVDAHLQWVRCYGQDEVYICGHDGTLLKGNARSGFVNVSAIDDNETWWCVCKFKDKIYLSAQSGLYVWDGHMIAPVVSGLTPEIETWRLDTDGTELWSFGRKDLTWFDGQQWMRLHDPDNTKIG